MLPLGTYEFENVVLVIYEDYSPSQKRMHVFDLEGEIVPNKYPGFITIKTDRAFETININRILKIKEYLKPKDAK